MAWFLTRDTKQGENNKNLFYKNVGAEICQNFKNMPRTQVESP